MRLKKSRNCTLCSRLAREGLHVIGTPLESRLPREPPSGSTSISVTSLQQHNMAPENILFSRARPGVTPTSKKIRGFLGLSGELRNKIYRYYFQEGFRCEVAAKGSDFCSNRTRRERGCPNILRMSRKLGNYKRVDGIQTNWSNSLCALILICRQVHHEAIIFLYQKTTFIFDAPKRITNFVEAVPGKNLANFTRVEMHYSTYGHPKSSNDQIWKEKHHASWSRAYKVAAKSLINLQVLKITVCTIVASFKDGTMVAIEYFASSGCTVNHLKAVRVSFDP